MRTLITPDGQAYPAECPSLRWLFGFVGAMHEVVDYAVRHCGAVLLEYRSRYRISVRPGTLSVAAFERLVGYLVANDRTPIIIVPAVPQGTALDIFLNVADAIARLDQFRVAPQLTPDARCFLANPMSVRRLFQSRERPALRAAYQAWQQSRGRISRKRLTCLLDNPIGATCLWTRPGRGDLPIIETEPSYFMNFWASTGLGSLIGKPMTDLPDPVYTEGALRGFLQVTREEEPQLETIDAIIVPPDAPMSVVRYDRLLLPWRTPDGERIISSNSFSRMARR